METYEYVIYIDTNNLNLKCQFFRFQDAKDGVVNVYEVDKIHDCLGKNATYIFDVKKEAEPKTWYILEASNGDGLERKVHIKRLKRQVTKVVLCQYVKPQIFL